MALSVDQLREALSAKKKTLPVPVLADAGAPCETGTTGEARESGGQKPFPVTKCESSGAIAGVAPKSGTEGRVPRRDTAGSSPAAPVKLPHSEEAERGALSSILNDAAFCFPLVEQRGIGADHFCSSTHQRIFNALSSMWNNSKPIDLVTLTQYLIEQNVLETVGGAWAVTELNNFVPSSVNVEYYLGIVHEKYLLREIIKRAKEMAERASQAQADPEEIIVSLTNNAAILASGLAERNGQLSLRRVSEIFSMTFDDTDNYFGDRVIAAGQPCTLLGPGDIGKSRLSLQLAICMISGRDFFDMPTHAVNKTWLFIQSENSCRRLYADLKNMIAGLELSQTECAQVEEHLLIHTLENDYDSFLSLEDERIYSKVQELIQKVKPDLIDWDPLNSLTDEDLNADVDMRKVCMKISHVTKHGNIARVPFVVHHALTGKTGAAKAVGWEKSSYGRNSKVLHAWTRAQINLAPRDPDDSTRLIMSCGKNNNGKAFPEIGVLFQEETGVYSKDLDFDPEAFRQDVGLGARKRVFTPQMIATLRWPAQLLDKKTLVKAILDEFGCGRSRAYELVDEAKKRGAIQYNHITSLYSKQ